MKKTILALLALGVFGVANAAYDGNPVTAVGQPITTQRTGVTNTEKSKTHAKITVTGEVVTNTCEIHSDDREKTVELKKVGINQLVKSGDIAADKLVQIRLVNCMSNTTTGKPTANKVTVAVIATNNIDYQNNGTLKNLDNSAQKAENVNIQLANLDGSAIRIGVEEEQNKVKAVSFENGNNVVQFLARYYATGQSKAGKVKGEAELDLAYE
ncbi:Major fimbrial subunit precursor [Haemophilus influenzae]|uniref:fimbrial protein n=1 Tax=Haemophilus influenzae TaxID=727 RepID=UPI000D4C3F34|nr:fimbrial protein [Haemophilus influenzae]PRM16685.1 Major fimbrial subunit precursor [Haemophilus influenzae]